jgi:predicted membrane channel-forming protein YqfA (hemolysin III family)
VVLEHACDVTRVFHQKQQAQMGINLPVRIAISIVVAQKILLSMFFIASNLHFFPRSKFYHQFSNHKCSNA